MLPLFSFPQFRVFFCCSQESNDGLVLASVGIDDRRG